MTDPLHSLPEPMFNHQLLLTRRQFFGNSGLRLGGLALATMAGGSLGAGLLGTTSAQANSGREHGRARSSAAAGLPHFPPKAKAIIYIHMNGGPSQIDLWDYKPQLAKYFDKELPDQRADGAATFDDDQRPIAVSRRAVDLQIRTTWPVGQMAQHAIAPAHREDR